MPVYFGGYKFHFLVQQFDGKGMQRVFVVVSDDEKSLNKGPVIRGQQLCCMFLVFLLSIQTIMYAPRMHQPVPVPVPVPGRTMLST